MIKEVLENGEKVVKIAEDIRIGGTLTTIMSIMLLSIFVFIFWGCSKWARNSMATMKEMSTATKDMAESIRALVDANVKKDESIHYQTVEFNSVRNRHVEEIKRVNDTASEVVKATAKIEIKLETIMLDIKELLTMTKTVK